MDAVRKEDSELTQIPPINPMMPFVPQILMSAMPTPIPQMKFEDGIIKNFFHNVKVAQMVKATESEAQIASHKRKYVEDSLGMVKAIVTFSADLDLTFKRMRHEEAMMAGQQAEGQVRLETAQAKLIEQQLKNMLLQGEVKLNDIEIKIKTKELNEVLNGSAEN